jgi:toxin secretion/phage lysis holin
MLDSLSTLGWTKICMYAGLGIVLECLFGPPTALLFALFVLFFMDTVIGISAAIYNHKFSSDGMRRGALKFLIYTSSIIIAHQFSLIPLLYWIEDALIAFLAMTELNSIGENIRKHDYYFPTFQDLKDVVIKAKKDKKEIEDADKL